MSFADFFTIQVTFPAMNAWITYQTLYVFFITISMLCPTDQNAEIAAFENYCPDYWSPLLIIAKDDPKNVIMYNWLFPGSIAALSLLFIEMSIYLAFYKDVIFASTTAVLFSGILLVTYKEELIEKSDESFYSLMSFLPTSTEMFSFA